MKQIFQVIKHDEMLRVSSNYPKYLSISLNSSIPIILETKIGWF